VHGGDEGDDAAKNGFHGAASLHPGILTGVAHAVGARHGELTV